MTSRRQLLLGGMAALAATGISRAQASSSQPASTPRSNVAAGGLIPARQRVRALVIGSGFGGSVAAYRLGLKGVETLVLERGRRWSMENNRGPFATSRQPDGRALWLSATDLLVTDGPKDPLPRGLGLVERYNEDGIIVWASSGVGGGSLVYNTVLLQPSEKNFYRCFPRDVSYEQMNREFYPSVVEIMDANPIPDDILLSSPYLGARIFQDLATRAGIPTQRINTATNWHVVRKELRGMLESSAVSGEIWYGGNSGYKNSLDKNYLKHAEATGKVKIQDHSHVTAIKEDGNRYLVEYEQLADDGRVISKHTVVCDYLFMAAGSMGTSSLLVRAKHKGTLPKLNAEIGKHWGNNGDTFGSMRIGLPAGSDKGGPAHIVGLDYENNPFGPQSVIGFPQPDNTEDSLIFLGMSIPQDSGYWDYDVLNDTPRLHWPVKSAGQKNTEDGMEYTLNKIADAITPSDRAIKARQSIKVMAGSTAHPCGGVVMGKACDLYGRVQGYKGLYVVDGAFIPLATAAANPALTIAAFAERSMANILSTDIQ
ncbi:MAG: GMC oxidoreductase [Cyanobium sp.]